MRWRRTEKATGLARVCQGYRSWELVEGDVTLGWVHENRITIRSFGKFEWLGSNVKPNTGHINFRLREMEELSKQWLKMVCQDILSKGKYYDRYGDRLQWPEKLFYKPKKKNKKNE